MIEFRPINDNDIPFIEMWLDKEHVKRWYEIPQLGITVDDWIAEIRAYKDEFQWITYLIVLWQSTPVGLCLYYKCENSKDEDFGTLPISGSYGIDYLIGEELYLGKGIGKAMITLLVDRIFSFPDAVRVTADTATDNVVSQKVLLSCGFTLWEPKRSRYVIYNKLSK